MEVMLGKKPSALVPAVMSLIALFLWMIQLITHGMQAVRAEGALAYLYLLLIAAQLPVIAIFLYRWLRQAPLHGLRIVLVQVLALAAALVPLHMMGW